MPNTTLFWGFSFIFAQLAVYSRDNKKWFLFTMDAIICVLFSIAALVSY